MWRNFIGKIKEVLRKMRLTSVTDVSQLRDLPIDDDFYKRIEVWKQLYKGHYPKWHDGTIQTINGEKKHRKESLNMPKIVAQEMANLVFNERCEITISDKGLLENITAVFEDNLFNVHFQNYLEYQFAMGGMVIRSFCFRNATDWSYSSSMASGCCPAGT